MEEEVSSTSVSSYFPYSVPKIRLFSLHAGSHLLFWLLTSILNWRLQMVLLTALLPSPILNPWLTFPWHSFLWFTTLVVRSLSRFAPLCSVTIWWSVGELGFCLISTRPMSLSLNLKESIRILVFLMTCGGYQWVAKNVIVLGPHFNSCLSTKAHQESCWNEILGGQIEVLYWGSSASQKPMGVKTSISSYFTCMKIGGKQGSVAPYRSEQVSLYMLSYTTRHYL